MPATKSQLLATASLHDKIAAAKARFNVQPKHQQRHKEDAAKLRAAAVVAQRAES